ncbi:DUF1043 domain-containing protein, partial [Pseudomonas syringae pv. actinidiae]|nr:DUF1043 domain-containing protein [Pseudomonas syringae pv. actinidiae]
KSCMRVHHRGSDRGGDPHCSRRGRYRLNACVHIRSRHDHAADPVPV